MGCFYTACALTGQTILPYKKVVGFIVIRDTNNPRSDDDYGLVYPWDKYNVVSMPIHGKYDDYGNMEGIKRDTVPVNHLKKLFPEVKLFKKDDKELSFDHDIFRNPVQAENGKTYRIGLMMITQAAFDFAIRTYQGENAKTQFIALHDHLKNEIDNIVPDKEKPFDHDLWHKKNELNKLLRFESSDYYLIRQFGSTHKYGYNNVLTAASMMSCNGGVAELTRFFSINHDRNISLEDSLINFDHWNDAKAIFDAFQQLGRQFVPTLYMGQEVNFEDIIDFSFDTILDATKSSVERSDGYGYDSENDEEYLVADRYLAKLEQSYEKIRAYLLAARDENISDENDA